MRRLPLRSLSVSSLACFDGTSHLYCFPVDPPLQPVSLDTRLPARFPYGPPQVRSCLASARRSRSVSPQLLLLSRCSRHRSSSRSPWRPAVASRRPGKLTTPSARASGTASSAPPPLSRFGLAVLHHTHLPPSSQPPHSSFLRRAQSLQASAPPPRLRTLSPRGQLRFHSRHTKARQPLAGPQEVHAEQKEGRCHMIHWACGRETETHLCRS